jgi:hypothetical protein
MSEQEAFDAAQVGAMPLVESVRVVEDSIVVVDAVFLNISVRPFPFDGWIPEIRGSNGKAAECPFDCRESVLHAPQVGPVQNEALKIDPFAFKPDLYPAVNDVARCEIVGRTGDGALLKCFVDCECVKPAWNATPA